MSHHEAQQIKRKLKPFITLLLVVACMGLLASCGGGGSATTSQIQTKKINDVSASDQVGFVGNEVVISFAQIDGLIVSLSTKPNGSNASLAKGENQQYKFTPDINGRYAITIQSADGSVDYIYNIRNKEYVSDFNFIKDTGLTPTTGKVANQYIFYTYLSEDMVAQTIKSLPGVSLVKITDSEIIVKADLDNDASLASIESLKQNSEFKFGGNRKIMERPTPKYFPDDGSRFDDAGDNWHLEKINMTAAWDFTTGSEEIHVAVMDDYLHVNHEEIKERYAKVKNGSESGKHGTGVSSTIAGAANNKKGISGINHKTKISFLTYASEYTSISDAYKDACDATSVTKLVNHSWGIPDLVDYKNPATGNSFMVDASNNLIAATTAIRNYIATDENYFFRAAYQDFSSARNYLETQNA
jgi:hypothetical protein